MPLQTDNRGSTVMSFVDKRCGNTYDIYVEGSFFWGVGRWGRVTEIPDPHRTHLRARRYNNNYYVIITDASSLLHVRSIRSTTYYYYNKASRVAISFWPISHDGRVGPHIQICSVVLLRGGRVLLPSLCQDEKLAFSPVVATVRLLMFAVAVLQPLYSPPP